MVCLGWLPEILTEGFAMPLNQLEFPFEDTRLFPVKDTCKHLGISRRTLERLVAVSYTHLDVYKRQVHPRLSQ